MNDTELTLLDMVEDVNSILGTDIRYEDGALTYRGEPIYADNAKQRELVICGMYILARIVLTEREEKQLQERKKAKEQKNEVLDD